MTHQEKIAFLCEYHNALIKVQYHLDRAALYRKYADEPNSPQYGPKAKPSNFNTEAPFMKWIKKAEEEDQAAEKLKASLQETKEKIVDAINSLEDVELVKLLMLRYVEWMKWPVIEKTLFLSESTRKRKHYEAIAALKI